MGRLFNFHFLVKKAVGEYFVWVPVDTFLLPEFLERNIAVLESQDKVVGCISKIKIVDNSIDRFETQKRILKKIGLVYRPFDTLPITGNYNERIRKYLKHFPWEMFYSVFRTKALRDSVVLNPSFLVGHDAGLVLNILKHGEIQVVDQILLESIPVGGAFTYKFYKNIMPYYPLTKWCIKNLGWKIFFRNIDHFLRLGLDGMIIQYTSFYKNIKEK
jgi:hypothetical protein